MERRVLLEDLQEQVVSCMLNALKLSPRTVYGQSSAYMKAVLHDYAKHGEKYYNPVLLNKFWAETEARYKRGEITKGHYLGKRKCLERFVECYNTGTLSWTLHKSKQKFRLSDEAQALLDEFLQTLVRDTNTTYDYSWGVRRYLNYLRGIGITDPLIFATLVLMQRCRIRLMMTRSSVFMGCGELHSVMPTSTKERVRYASHGKNVIPTNLCATIAFPRMHRLVGITLKSV